VWPRQSAIGRRRDGVASHTTMLLLKHAEATSSGSENFNASASSEAETENRTTFHDVEQGIHTIHDTHQQ
jgi:hypothetical protein